MMGASGRQVWQMIEINKREIPYTSFLKFAMYTLKYPAITRLMPDDGNLCSPVAPLIYIVDRVIGAMVRTGNTGS